MTRVSTIVEILKIWATIFSNKNSINFTLLHIFSLFCTILALFHNFFHIFTKKFKLSKNALVTSYKPLSLLALEGRKYLRNVSFNPPPPPFILLGSKVRWLGCCCLSWSNWVIDGLWRNISRGLRSQNAIKTSSTHRYRIVLTQWRLRRWSFFSQKMKFKPFGVMFVTEKIYREWLCYSDF